MSDEKLIYRDGLRAWAYALTHIKGPSGYLGVPPQGRDIPNTNPNKGSSQ